MEAGQLGTDVGGTFTDLVYYDSAGKMTVVKVPSVPSSPGRGPLDGIDALVEELGLPAEQVAAMHHTHSSTVATNALIERTGRSLGFIVNSGFGDLLEIQRLAAREPLRFDSSRPEPLIPRWHVREVDTRVTADGTIVVPLDGEGVKDAVRHLVDESVTGIVICFLHSYRHPEAERRARELIKDEFPEIQVDISSEVWPQAREYERGVTATINGYIRPVVEDYLTELTQGLISRGLKMPATVARSNGGMQSAATVLERPIVLALSGPAAGVAGAAREAAHAGMPNADLITVDLGGTSADIGVVRRGQPLLTADEHVADQPLLLPTVAVSSIGAGGGSILSVDSTGTLKIGPRSVGASPGPACYGRQHELAALTDAFVACGWMSDDWPLGGRLSIRTDLSTTALNRLALPLDITARDLAAGAIDVALAMMASEATRVLARRGVDAPDFTLVPFGGAGPLLGALLAEHLLIRKVLIPATPGALSAVGAALANLESDHIWPIYGRLDHLPSTALKAAFDGLHNEALEWFERERMSLPIEGSSVRWTAEMRYEGQGWDVETDIDPQWLVDHDVESLADAFHEAHRAMHGHINKKAAVWLKEVRAHLIGTTIMPESSVAAPPVSERGEALHRPTSQRAIRIGEREVDAQIIDKQSLAVGDEVEGPAVVCQMDTTILVPPRWRGTLTESDAMILIGEGA